jgi:hypothetical protein
MLIALPILIALDLGAGRASSWPAGDLVEVAKLVEGRHGAALLLRPPTRWSWGGPGLQRCRAAYSEPNGGLLACEGRPAVAYTDPAALGELLDLVEAPAVALTW